jgi:hypothetical protein
MSSRPAGAVHPVTGSSAVDRDLCLYLLRARFGLMGVDPEPGEGNGKD